MKIYISKILAGILLMCPGSIAEAQQKSSNQFVLNGNLSGQNNGLIYLYYFNIDNQRLKDSAIITNGKFSFKGNINEPTIANLILKEEKRSQNNSINFFMEPAVMSISLDMNKFEDAKFAGSKTQTEYAALEAKKRKIRDRWKLVMDTLSAVNKRSNIQFQELKEWVLHPYNKEMKELDYTFFATHSQSYVTAYLLRFHVSSLSLDTLQMFYDKLGKKIQQSKEGKDVANEIQKFRGGSPGSLAKNFEATDINGSKLNLSEFRGKYVLLDFWASWCVPCRKGNPHLKDLYAKYKNRGIEFIGISDDDRNHEAWKQAVEKDGLPWRHVLRGLNMEKRLKNEPYETDINEKFGIHTLPTKILIDREGKIIARYSEKDGPLDAKLKELLGD